MQSKRTVPFATYGIHHKIPRKTAKADQRKSTQNITDWNKVFPVDFSLSCSQFQDLLCLWAKKTISVLVKERRKEGKAGNFREEELLSEPGFSLHTRPPKSLELCLCNSNSVCVLVWHCFVGSQKRWSWWKGCVCFTSNKEWVRESL